MKRLLLAVALFAALTAAATATAAPAPLRPLTGRVDQFVTDGLRYAAWGSYAATTLTVMDTRTGARQTVGKPEGCVPFGPAGRTPVFPRLRLFCAAGTMLMDVATGAMAPDLPLGSDPEHRALPTCSPLDRLARHALEGDLRADFDHVALLQVAQTRIRLLRCGRPSLVVGTRSHSEGGDAHPQVSAGWATWDDAWELWVSDDGPSDPGANLHAVAVRTGRRFAWTAPRIQVRTCFDELDHGAYGETQHTRYRLFWVAAVEAYADKVCDDTVHRVFSAPLPGG